MIGRLYVVEHRRAQEHAGENFADDGGLAKPHHQLAEQPGSDKENENAAFLSIGMGLLVTQRLWS